MGIIAEQIENLQNQIITRLPIKNINFQCGTNGNGTTKWCAKDGNLTQRGIDQKLNTVTGRKISSLQPQLREEQKRELDAVRPETRDVGTITTNDYTQKTGGILQTLTNAVENPLVIGGVVLIGGAIVVSMSKRK